MESNKYYLFACAIVVSFCFSCSTTNIAVNVTADVLEKGIGAFFEEDDLILARRGLESNLKLLEVFHKANPKNIKLTNLLAQAYGGYTFIFLEDDLLLVKNKREQIALLERINKFYNRGLQYGLKSIQKNNANAYKDIQNNNFAQLEKSVKKITDKNALFWTVFNWSLLLNLNRTNPDVIAQLPKIKILINRMNQLDKHFFYGAPLALQGTLECVMPRMLGGKPEYGIDLMKQALKSSNKTFLIVQLLYAQYCTPVVQDYKNFNLMFDEINKLNYKINNDVILINYAIKKRAKLIKKNTSLLFIDED